MEQIRTMGQTQSPSEKPIYIFSQSKTRALIPKIVSLLLLGSIFYLGIIVNIVLLDLRSSTEDSVKMISLIILAVLIILGIILSILRARIPFNFYRNRIMFKKKSIFYKNIINITPKRDLWDKLLKTHSINLGNNFVIRHIPDHLQLENYLQQLKNYAERLNQRQ